MMVLGVGLVVGVGVDMFGEDEGVEWRSWYEGGAFERSCRVEVEVSLREKQLREIVVRLKL